MKRVRITIHPPDVYFPRAYELLTGEAGHVGRVRIVNWNVSTPPAGFLLRVRADARRLEDALAGVANVRDYELFPIADGECYCFLAAEEVTVGRALFDNFTRGSLMTVPPIECHEGGSSTFTIIGTETDIEAAVAGVPDGVDVEVEAVGGEKVASDSVVGRLSVRQREAMETAVEIGYYDVPREATGEDVARELGCATATASEHLRKAEVKLVRSLFDE